MEKTQQLGKKIASKLEGGEILFLSGILGAGKTELIRGIAKGLGIKDKITSPTFNIFRVYERLSSGHFYHFDCYRLNRYADLVELGWEDIRNEEGSIIVLEWPECIKDKDITKSTRSTKINIKLENGRRIINCQD